MIMLRSFAVVAFAGLLSGCTGLFGVSPTPESVLADHEPPIVSDRFLLNDSMRVVGELQRIEAHHTDTFVDIARTYNVGFDELVEANPDVDPWLPGAGTRIILPTRYVLPDAEQKGIVINIASKRLFYYPEPDEDGARVVVTYPIGIGREGSATPLGVTTVASKGRNPVWFPPASIRREYAAEGNPLPARVQPGPDNPLGKFVLVLGMPSYLIHGTNRPAGVGMRVSHGCVRLFPENIASLYEMADVGVQVAIVNQPYLLAWQDGQLLLEAHQPLADDTRDWAQLLPQMLTAAQVDAPSGNTLDEQRVSEVIASAAGVPMPILAGSPDPERLWADAMQVHNLVVEPLATPDAVATSQNIPNQ